MRPHDTAYCVATLDITTDPPVVAHVSIYSANAANLTAVSHRYCNVDVLSADGGSYHEAHGLLLQALAGSFIHRWAFRWIHEKRSHR